MIETGEQLPPLERIPTYDSFGDHDEALVWVVDKMRTTLSQDELTLWWTSAHEALNDMSPEQVWSHSPDALIGFVAYSHQPKIAAGRQN